jgi:hypothetical protein
MAENPTPISATRKTGRPVLLSILCSLTFLCSGSATLLSLTGIFASGWVLRQVESMIPGVVDYSGTFFIILFLAMFIVWALSLWGAILMFGLRKGGFILYLIPNGLLLVLQVILTISAFNIYFLLSDLLSILFIVLYATQVKHMKE